MAEDQLFAAMLHKLKIPQPANGLAVNEEEALEASKNWATRFWCVPALSWGGGPCKSFIPMLSCASMRFAVASPERPVLVDKFLEHATEVDVDCICDADG